MEGTLGATEAVSNCVYGSGSGTRLALMVRDIRRELDMTNGICGEIATVTGHSIRKKGAAKT